MNHEPHCPPDALCIWCREESLKARLEEVSAERDEARERFVELLYMMLPQPDGEPVLTAGTLNVPLTGSPLVMLVIEAMVAVLKEGPGNFRVISFRSQKDGQEYSLTIQKEGGKTPAQRITELEEEVKSLLENIALQLETVGKYSREAGNIAELRRKIGECATRAENVTTILQVVGLVAEMREESEYPKRDTCTWSPAEGD